MIKYDGIDERKIECVRQTENSIQSGISFDVDKDDKLVILRFHYLDYEDKLLLQRTKNMYLNESSIDQLITELRSLKTEVAELAEESTDDETSLNALPAARCPLVEIDQEALELCIQMYKNSEKVTAIKWLIEEARRPEYTFDIKWAHEYFQSLGLEAVEPNAGTASKPAVAQPIRRRSLPLSNQKLYNMAHLITEKQKAAKERLNDNVDWRIHEETWFDWLEKELFGNFRTR